MKKLFFLLIFFVLAILLSGCLGPQKVSGDVLAQKFEVADQLVAKSGYDESINPMANKQVNSIDEIIAIYKSASYLQVLSEEKEEKSAKLKLDSDEVLIIELNSEAEAKAFIIQLHSQIENTGYVYKGRLNYVELCNLYQYASSNIITFQTGRFVLISKDLVTNI